MARSQPPITVSGRDRGPETQREYVPPGGRTNLILELKHDGVAQSPVMAVYAPRKPVPYNYGCIDAANQKCLEALAMSPDASASIVGVHIPSIGDDPRLDEVLTALCRLRGGVVYIGPNDDDRNSAKQHCFTLGPSTLADFLTANEAA
jgi:hypothetical protein